MNTATDFVDHVTDAAAGVTYHFSHSVEVGRYWNGDIFVVSDGSDIEITRITPDSRALESGRIVNGAVVDPSIDNSQGALNGFDSGIAYNSYDPTSNADPGTTGTSLVISHDAHPEGVSIVKVVSNEGFTDARHATYDNSVLTIVNEVPPAGAFRPAVAAASKESTFTIDDLDFSVLQSVEPVEGQRPLSDFDDLPDATVASWITQGSESRGHYPTKYFDDYGDYRMEQLADGFMALHSNYSDAEKADLYASFVQIGLDYAGAVDAGKTFTSGGGGLNNYVKPFVVLAAAALDDEGLSETAGYRPSVYGEDQQFFYVSEEHTAHESFNWGGNKKPTFQEQYAAEQIGLPEWGLFTFDNRNSSLLDSNPYRSINSDTMIQVALVTEMLGADATAIWGNQAYFDYADRSYDIYGDKLSGAWRAFYEQYHETYKTSVDWEGAPETILQLDVRESPDGVFVHIGMPDEGAGLPVLRTDLRYSADGETWTILTDVGAETTLTDVPAGTFLYVQARHVNDIGAGRWSLNNFTTTNATIHKTLQGLGFVDIPEAYGTDYGLGRKEYASLSTSYKDHLRDLLDGIEDPGVGSSVQTFIHGAIQIAPESERDQLRDARSVFLETFEGEDNTGLPVQPVEDGRALRMEDAGVRASFDWPSELRNSNEMTLSLDFKLDPGAASGEAQTLLYWSGISVLRIDQEAGMLAGVTGLDIKEDTWHQVVLTLDPSTGFSNLYFDGTLIWQKEGEAGGALNLSTHKIYLGDPFAFGSDGAARAGRSNIEGFIDNLEVFDSALSDEEIAERFSEGLPSEPETSLESEPVPITEDPGNPSEGESNDDTSSDADDGSVDPAEDPEKGTDGDPGDEPTGTEEPDATDDPLDKEPADSLEEPLSDEPADPVDEPVGVEQPDSPAETETDEPSDLDLVEDPVAFDEPTIMEDPAEPEATDVPEEEPVDGDLTPGADEPTDPPLEDQPDDLFNGEEPTEDSRRVPADGDPGDEPTGTEEPDATDDPLDKEPADSLEEPLSDEPADPVDEPVGVEQPDSPAETETDEPSDLDLVEDPVAFDEPTIMEDPAEPEATDVPEEEPVDGDLTPGADEPTDPPLEDQPDDLFNGEEPTEDSRRVPADGDPGDEPTGTEEPDATDDPLDKEPADSLEEPLSDEPADPVDEPVGVEQPDSPAETETDEPSDLDLVEDPVAFDEPTIMEDPAEPEATDVPEEEPVDGDLTPGADEPTDPPLEDQPDDLFNGEEPTEDSRRVPADGDPGDEPTEYVPQEEDLTTSAEDGGEPDENDPYLENLDDQSGENDDDGGGEGLTADKRPHDPEEPDTRTPGTDVIVPGEKEESDELISRDGDDTLQGGEGEDLLSGGQGDDLLVGGGSSDELLGGGGADVLIGGGGDDTLSGGRAADTLNGGAGDDKLEGGGGRDRLVGRSGDDQLAGGGGADTLRGNAGADVLEGGVGRDLLVGGTGADVLEGGVGRDLLVGGTGADSFVFGDNFGRDRIADFGVGADVLDFSQHSGVGSLEDLVIFQGATGTVINDGAAGRILLSGVDVTEINVTDFFF